MRLAALLLTGASLAAAGCLTPGGGSGLLARTGAPAGPPTEPAANEAALAPAEGFERDGNDAGAVAAYERARQLDPAVADRAAHRLAILYDRTDEPAKATAEFQALLKRHPRDAALLCDAGYSCYSRGRWAEAEALLRKAVVADRAAKRAWNNLGLALAMQGKDGEAIEAFEKAVTPAEAQANLGYCLAVRGKKDEAAAAYRRALELEPALPSARAALARLESPAAGATGVGLALPDAPLADGQ